ncbi:type II CRISPR RNA-guided endonuclease Cas9 [Brochothrix campestris]|uniref:type II CRISPR RNA-guided endonuclease Cas9 n=1 Tax=Brochothrix campestris TaxID=2757 RepID=UPI0038D17A75
MTNENKNTDYNIGLDIGVASVGWAVTASNDNELLQAKKKNLWGVSLFEEGQAAAERRGYRSTRRRLRHRKFRLQLLEDLFEADILQTDPSFFIRLKEAFLSPKDNQKTYKGSLLFQDESYSDVDYYQKFPTIYHLRQHLMTTTEAADIREIYLALHHIIKYRGHFVYEQQTFTMKGSQVGDDLRDLQAKFRLIDNYLLDDVNIASLSAILTDNQRNKSTKVRDCVSLTGAIKESKKRLTQLFNLIVGLKANIAILFDNDSFLEVGKDVTMAAEDIDVKLAELNDVLDEEQFSIVEKAQYIYSSIVLHEIMKGKNNVSAAKVATYHKHAADLAAVKTLLRQDDVTMKERQLFETSYANYIKNTNLKEDFLKRAKGLLEHNRFAGNDVAQQLLADIDVDDFMEVQRHRGNGAIPFQVHQQELLAILENQGQFYPFLREQAANIQKLLTFRIPYYVGPLADEKDSQFAWMIRKQVGKITPFNFEEMVDIDASSEAFIKRMTNKCTYLLHEDVLPKNSLVYAKFEVLNELNKIRLDNRPLDVALKQRIYECLFMHKQKVTHKQLKKWLAEHEHLTVATIQGTQKETEFATSLTAYHRLQSILGAEFVNQPENQAMVEQIIYWSTVFEDKKIMRRKLEAYPQLTAKQVTELANLRLRGWGRLSRKLLTEIKVAAPLVDNEPQSLLALLWQTNDNLMQVLRQKDYGFQTIIDEQFEGETRGLSKEVIDELATSPANKKAIWQAIKIVKELEKVKKRPAKNIFIEFARSDEQSKRTNTRDKFIEKAFAKLKIETDAFNKELLAELREHRKNISQQRLFLYFIQNGKCMYTGETLQINDLSSYEVDHILPQSYIKDNSIENLALVKRSENQRKGADLLLDSTVITKNRTRWEQLKRAGLIGEKKFRNLTRTKITDRDKEGFVARQLVETRQITKHVTQLLQKEYQTDTKVVAIKAGLVSDLRHKFNFIKNRNVNDYHHAQDAYLVSFIGTYIMSKYPKLEMEFVYEGYNKYLADLRKTTTKPKFSFIVESLAKPTFNHETGELFWNPETDIAKVRRTLNFKQCNIVRKVEEQSGMLFKETIYPALKAADKTIPLKKNLGVSLYGGYTNVNYAFYSLIEYPVKNKQKRRLLGIPMATKVLIDTGQTTLQAYVTDCIGGPCQILKERVLKYQLIQNDNCALYVAGPTERHNARQLVVSEAAAQIIYLISAKQAAEASFLEQYRSSDLTVVFDELLLKITSDFKIFKNVAVKLTAAAERFNVCTFNEKVIIIEEIIKVMRANATNGNLKLLGLTEREGRLGNVPISNNLKIINQSITGLYQSIEDFS